LDAPPGYEIVNCYKKKGEEREREQKQEREALASPFASIFKTDYPCDL